MGCRLAFMEIVGTDLIHCPQGSFGPHQHSDQYEFHYLLGARGRFSNGGITTTLEGDSLAFTPPLHDHGFTGSRPQPQPIYFIRFRPQNQADSQLILEVSRSFGMRPRAIPSLAPAFEQIRRHSVAQGGHARRAAECGLEMVLHAAAGGGFGSGREACHPVVQDALAALEGSLNRPVSFRHLVSRSGYSAEGFSRLFRRETGESALGYLRRRRLEHARFDLETTDDPIHRIAARYAFCDEFHFSRMFKKETRHAPREWREMSRRSRGDLQPSFG